MLTLCRQVTHKDMIGIPCIVDGSHISAFSYTMSCTCVCQLVWLTYRFKVIDSLMQDVWASSYKQTVCSWPPFVRIIFMQQRDHSFRYTLFVFCNFFQLQSGLCIGVFWEKTIFCVCYMRIHILMSLIIVTMKFWTVTSPQLVYVNKCHLLP